MFGKKQGKSEQDERFGHLSDNELVKLIISSGEERYLREIYARYSNKVYGKCILLTKDKVTSMDLVHDIFIKIFTNISKFRGDSDFSFWVHSITYNHCIAYLNKQKKTRFSELDDSFNDVGNGREHEESIIREAKLHQLEESFKELREDDRLILMMYYKNDFSVTQIAERLEIGNSAVKMRLKRARNRLYKLLTTRKDWDYEG